MNTKKWSLNTVKLVAATLLLNVSATAQTYVKYDANNNWQYAHKDYKLKHGPIIKDTMIIIDPVNGDEIIRETVTDPEIALANEKKVFSTDEVNSTVQNGDKLEKYLLKKLSKKLQNLQTDNEEILKIDLSHVIVNEKGKVIYYEYDGVDRKSKDGKISKVSVDLNEDINRLMKKHPKLQPATVNGENVIAYTHIGLNEYRITVNDKNVYYNKKRIHH